MVAEVSKHFAVTVDETSYRLLQATNARMVEMEGQVQGQTLWYSSDDQREFLIRVQDFVHQARSALGLEGETHH